MRPRARCRDWYASVAQGFGEPRVDVGGLGEDGVVVGGDGGEPGAAEVVEGEPHPWGEDLGGHAEEDVDLAGVVDDDVGVVFPEGAEFVDIVGDELEAVDVGDLAGEADHGS